MVLNAVKLVKQGKVATLGKVYQQDAPAFGSRGWRMTIPGLPTGGPFGEQELIYNDEYLSTEIGQIGTQFDGPAHIGVITSKGEFSSITADTCTTRISPPTEPARSGSST